MNRNTTRLIAIIFQIIFIHSLFSTAACAQGKFIEGYIISPKGDTTQGYIRYEAWDESPSFVDFSALKSRENVQKLGSEQIVEFYLTAVDTRYRSKTIGILNIDLSQSYAIAPSIQAKDSLTIFLRQLVSGKRASLFEFINASGASHYFLEKDSKLTELINYPFHRLVGEKKYLLTYDEYKQQLKLLLPDADANMSVPSYNERSLKKYIALYNGLFEEEKNNSLGSYESAMSVDLNFTGGTEAWKEPGIIMRNKMTYGLGMRVNFARRFNNRYFKMNLLFIPGIKSAEMYYNNSYMDEKLTVKTIEFGLGKYFGSGKFRPNFGIDYSYALDGWRSPILGPHVGFSYRRQLSLEISHFANFYSLFSEIPFISKARFSLNYYLNLNKLFVRK